jgi:hypothetical protein
MAQLCFAFFAQKLAGSEKICNVLFGIWQPFANHPSSHNALLVATGFS